MLISTRFKTFMRGALALESVQLKKKKKVYSDK